jgi:DNA topoisomerase-3
MTRVFIAEKPSLAEVIAKAINSSSKKTSSGKSTRPTHWDCGNGTLVTWCYGHLLEQAAPDSYDERNKDWVLAYLPIIPVQWRKYVKNACKDQFASIGQLIAKADEVVNAGDPDREGNLLIDEVLEAHQYQGMVSRIWLLGLDNINVKKALADLQSNAKYRGFTDAAEARGRADWLIGMNCTRGFTIGWKSRGNSGTLHIGRVQTPTLWMVVERDRIIENFKPIDFYVPHFDFMHANGKFQVVWAPEKGLQGLDEAGRIVDRSRADAVIRRVSGAQGTVASLETKPHVNPPPLPFSLAALQKEANKKLGFSPDKTLDLAQVLYETYKITTYPRSDCGFLPEAMHADAPTVLAAVKANMGGDFECKASLDLNRKSPAFNDSKVGAHFGITPNANRCDFSRLKPDEQSLYRLIVRNYLAQFCENYEYEGTAVTVLAEQEKFTAHGKVDKVLGWRVLFGADEDEEKGQQLPVMAQGDAGTLKNGIVDAKKTTPPARYNGASLIDDMENAHKFIKVEEIRKRLRKSKGIGTEATRSTIVKQLISRGYLEEVGRGKKTYYLSTTKGRALINCLPDAIRLPDLTAYFEELLSQVEEGQMSCDEFTEKQAGFVTRLISEISSGVALANMPTGMIVQANGHVAEQHFCTEGDCKLPLRRIPRKDNKKVFFWMCDNKHFYDDKAGKPVASQKKPATSAPVSTDLDCPACGAKLLVRSGKKGRFYACSKYPSCSYTADFKEGAEVK